MNESVDLENAMKQQWLTNLHASADLRKNTTKKSCSQSSNTLNTKLRSADRDKYCTMNTHSNCSCKKMKSNKVIEKMNITLVYAVDVVLLVPGTLHNDRVHVRFFF